MKPLTPEEMSELRADVACLDIPDDRLDEMIRLIDSIIISIIDQNSGRHAVQLSLSARANYAFQNRQNSQDFSCPDGHHPVAFNDDDGLDSSHHQIRFEPG